VLYIPPLQLASFGTDLVADMHDKENRLFNRLYAAAMSMALVVAILGASEPAAAKSRIPILYKVSKVNVICLKPDDKNLRGAICRIAKRILDRHIKQLVTVNKFGPANAGILHLAANGFVYDRGASGRWLVVTFDLFRDGQADTKLLKGDPLLVQFEPNLSGEKRVIGIDEDRIEKAMAVSLKATLIDGLRANR